MMLPFEELAITSDELGIAAVMLVVMLGGMGCSTGRGHGRRVRPGIAPGKRWLMSKRCAAKKNAAPRYDRCGMQLTPAAIVLIAA